MVNEICVGCGKVMGEISAYDAKFIGDSTCWECADEAEYAEYLQWVNETGYENV